MNELTKNQLQNQIDTQLHELANLNLSLRRTDDPITRQYIIGRMQNKSVMLHVRTANLGTGLAEQGRKLMEEA